MADNKHKVVQVENLNNSLFFLEVERNGLKFISGQHVTINVDNVPPRVYSISSGINDLNLRFLIREIPSGILSPKLRNLKKGDRVTIGNPGGYFTLNSKEDIDNNKIYLIATGSGISPFLSFSNSYCEKRLVIIHGFKQEGDSFENRLSNNVEYISCSSNINNVSFKGRVTDYLKNITMERNLLFYLCGNGNMIYEAFNILRNKGLSSRQIIYEEYFN